jgi:fumarate reductase subunit D
MLDTKYRWLVIVLLVGVLFLLTAEPALAHDDEVHPSDLELLLSAVGIVVILIAAVIPLKSGQKNIDHIWADNDD